MPLNDILMLIDNAAWLGATDRAVEGVFRWIGSDQPLIYTNWGTGEPNNYNGEEDCLLMSQYEDWNDVRCSATLAYSVCELPRDP